MSLFTSNSQWRQNRQIMWSNFILAILTRFTNIICIIITRVRLKTTIKTQESRIKRTNVTSSVCFEFVNNELNSKKDFERSLSPRYLAFSKISNLFVENWIVYILIYKNHLLELYYDLKFESNRRRNDSEWNIRLFVVAFPNSYYTRSKMLYACSDLTTNKIHVSETDSLTIFPYFFLNIFQYFSSLLRKSQKRVGQKVPTRRSVCATAREDRREKKKFVARVCNEKKDNEICALPSGGVNANRPGRNFFFWETLENQWDVYNNVISTSVLNRYQPSEKTSERDQNVIVFTRGDVSPRPKTRPDSVSSVVRFTRSRSS